MSNDWLVGGFMERFSVCSATSLLRRAVLWSLILTSSAIAQSTVALSGFTPGARQLVALDIATTALGELPAGIKQLNGAMEVVLKNGVHMLRASAPTDFLVQLPEVLPQDFTIEFDFIAKACCNPEDVSFEGTPAKSRAANSAHVVWHRDILSVVGGGPMYQAPVSEETKKSLRGTLITAAYSMEGETLKLYTNGRRLYTLNDRKFVRARTLRVFLGGQDEDKHAVYLARLRIAAGGPSATIALNPPASGPAMNSGPLPQPNAPSTSGNSGASGGPTPTIVTNVTVSDSPNGPVVNWLGGAAPAIYTVQRWKSDDPACCSTTSPASPPLTGPPWQDTPPPLSGTYVYRVTATTNAGSANDEAQFQYLRTGGGTIVAQPGAVSSAPRTLSTGTSTPAVSTPIAAADAGLTPTPFAVTVTMGSAGPIVSWPALKDATGYGASRSKIDDLNCCNTSSGRSLISASSWQDQPLPATGTYIYTVIATTPLGPIKAEAHFAYTQPGTTAIAPVGVLPATPTTGTITPQPAPAPTSPTAPSGVTRDSRPTVVSNAAGPTDLTVSGSPVRAYLKWTVVPGATRYHVNRAIAGSTNWVSLGADPVAPDGTGYGDSFPDPARTYTYQVLAYQPDGSYGAATVDFTPPPATDPTGFTATQTGPGAVKLEWNAVPPGDFKMYLITGPGAETGISTYDIRDAGIGPNPPDQRKSYQLVGLPAGTHTWTIATQWDPGGVLTPASAWPRATAAVTADSPARRYRFVVLGFKADSPSKDINNAIDGIGDEVYFSAVVNQTTLTRLPLPVTRAPNLSIILSRSYGDEAVSVPYGRIKAGTASKTGGLMTGDKVPANLELQLPDPTGTLRRNQFPMPIWQGALDDSAVVVVHVALWEDDVDPRVQALWARLLSDAARTGYQFAPPDYRGSSSNESARRIYQLSAGPPPVRPIESIFSSENSGLGENILQCTTIAVDPVRRPCEAHGVDRPFGLWNASPSSYNDRLVVLTRAGIERALSDRTTNPKWVPGTFAMRLNDDTRRNYEWSLSEGKWVMALTEAMAVYHVYFRVERVP